MPGLDETIVYDTVKGFMFESDKKPFSPRLVEYPVTLSSLSDSARKVEVGCHSDFQGGFESVASNGRVRITSKK
jgi:hypothetical protein